MLTTIYGFCLYLLCACIGLQIFFDICDGLRRPLNLIEPLLRRVFRYRDIPARKGEGVYLRRFYLTPRTRPRWWPNGRKWYRFFLHMILLSDDDEFSHDHPWSFVSMILGGSYREHVYRPNTADHWLRRTIRIATPGTILINAATHTHKVEIIRPVWSLVLSPEAEREWGFWVSDGPGVDHWVQWDEYLGIKGEARAEEDRMRLDRRPVARRAKTPTTVEVFTPSEAAWFTDSGPMEIESATVEGAVVESLKRRSE